MNLKEHISGAVLLALTVIAGALWLDGSIFFRLLVGLGLGYALSRASLGFAGSVNRAYRAGSTRLLRHLMLLFVLTALATCALLIQQDVSAVKLWVKPLNVGLLVGGLMFGFGMAIAGCCASGVLTYFSSNVLRPAIALLFFGMGVFLGFPLQATQSWIRDTWVSSASFPNKGVFLPDLFSTDPLGGYLGAMLLTALFASIVSWFAIRYERSRREQGSFIGVHSEVEQQQGSGIELTQQRFFSRETYHALFIARWSPITGIAVIVLMFMLLMGVTGSGWGASTPFGLWFGRLLILCGVDAADVAAFSHKSVQAFTMPFFSHAVTVQNIGIIIGALVSLLLAGRFASGFSRLPLSAMEVALLAVAGLSMGFGTRFANGCNVGALFTPIANFSLSGWVFLLVMITGGVLGNMLRKRLL
ncbi:membrane protein [Shewanella mangrovi]|uniref:Membrane protein n=1 Tax=Shewanella mangrovi TaxID=1515746 RepID=A0A094K017_9GAMM|nr:YeeE/YedE family protein [Shewanella mangrovi]KFZ37991.1 membrane protein [Shewanella mangrovi]